uniref:WRKY domain-containing protein n=1 Tax=Oryza glaberrima TaxID=4538 RepID=I1R250_ORYGL
EIRIFLQKNLREGAHKSVGSRKEPQMERRKVRMSYTEDDGFSWRKYGQKDVEGAVHPRSYFRCAHKMTTGCKARKKVQHTDGDPLMVDVVYEGVHSCAGVHSAASSKSNLRPTKSIQVRASSKDVGPPDDGYSWKRYGQKNIFGANYPRCYYRCIHKTTTGCSAEKNAQATDGDPLLFDVVYHGEHTCDLLSTHSNDVEPISPQSGLDDDMCTDDTTTVSTRHDSNTDASSISSQLDWTNCKDELDGPPTTL